MTTFASKEQFKLLVHSISDIFPESFDFKVDVSYLDFEGFNAQKLLDAFYDKAKGLPDEEVKSDIRNICAIALKRGNIRKDQVAKTEEKGRTLINKLADKYGIQIRKSKTEKLDLGPTKLSFSRALAIFPNVASTWLYQQPSEFKNTQLSGEFGSNVLPDVLHHSGAAAVIPPGEIGKCFLTLHTGYMCEFSLLVNDDAKKKTKQELFLEQARFGKAAWGSGFTHLTTRIEWFKQFGLNKKSVVQAVVKEAIRVRELVNVKDVPPEAIAQVEASGDFVYFIDKKVEDGITKTVLPKSGPPEPKPTAQSSMQTSKPGKADF